MAEEPFNTELKRVGERERKKKKGPSSISK